MNRFLPRFRAQCHEWLFDVQRRQPVHAGHGLVSAPFEQSVYMDFTLFGLPVGALLGGMSLLTDGGTADPAAWHDWEAAVTKIRSGKTRLELGLRDDG